MAEPKDGYIPPSIQHAMDQQLQRMPANLQKYQSGNTYIPSGAAKSMANYMEKTMPAHMQQYVSQYMKQKVTAGLNSLDPGTPRPVQSRSPVAPNLLRRDHSGPGEQFTVNIPDKAHSNGTLSFSPQYSSDHHSQQSASSAPPPVVASTDSGQTGNHNPYAFIFEEKKKPKKSLMPSGNSKSQRIIFIVMGLVILLLLTVLIMGVLGSKGATDKVELEGVAAQEQEVIRIAGIGTDQATDATTKNLAATTASSLSSNQTVLLAALKKNNIKLGNRELAARKNPATDDALNQAAQASNFDQAFTQEMNNELTSLQTNVQKAYNNNTSSRSLSAALSQTYQTVTALLPSTH